MSTPVHWLLGAPRDLESLTRWILAQSQRLPADLRDDIAQDVILKFVSSVAEIAQRFAQVNPLAADLGALSDAELEGLNLALRAYVAAMLRNRLATVQRQRRARGTEVVEVDLPDDRGLSTEATPEEVRERIAPALEWVLAHTSGRPDDKRRTLADLVAVAVGESDVEAMVQREVGPDADDRTFEMARDRLYKRFARAREGLLDAAAALVRSKEVRGLDRERMYDAIEQLRIRRPKGRG